MHNFFNTLTLFPNFFSTIYIKKFNKNLRGAIIIKV